MSQSSADCRVAVANILFELGEKLTSGDPRRVLPREDFGSLLRSYGFGEYTIDDMYYRYACGHGNPFIKPK